jgi:ribonuclease H / adenosylcobalamin/alpha-ribazole phosphatase
VTDAGSGRAAAGRRLLVEADGGSRGNPGPAGYGAVVRDADTGEVLVERAAGLGQATNNVAEYSGLVAGLAAAVELSPSQVEVRMDSKLVVEQMSGRWQVKHPDLKPLAREAAALVRQLPAVRFVWVRREENRHADRLANEAMDAEAEGRSWQPAPTPGPAVRPHVPPTVGAEPGVPLSATGWTPPAAAPTRMLLLRHGETPYSADRRFLGRRDMALTPRGVEQGRAAVRRLSTVPDVAAVVT